MPAKPGHCRREEDPWLEAVLGGLRRRPLGRPVEHAGSEKMIGRFSRGFLGWPRFGEAFQLGFGVQACFRLGVHKFVENPRICECA